MKSFDDVTPQKRKVLARFHNGYGDLKLLRASSKDLAKREHQVTINDLSSDQREAYNQLIKWAHDRDNLLLTMGGYAGTGKTTLVALLAQALHQQEFTLAFCAYTGKASNVLRQKLSSVGVRAWGDNYCGTIHSLIYIPILDEKSGLVKGWELRDELPFDVIIVDEASMVDEEIFGHLSSYGRKILAVGDHGQLPPIGRSSKNLMTKPQIRLEKIHRQAAGNPIIMTSAEIRMGLPLEELRPGDDRVQVIPKQQLSEAIEKTFTHKATLAQTALCYRNSTRIKLNRYIRGVLGFPATPSKKDVIICLRNTRFGVMRVYNGMRGLLDSVELEGSRYNCDISFPDDNLELDVWASPHQFGLEKTIGDFTQYGASGWVDLGMLFDWGYCLTVHKAQGSQFNTVVVVVERGSYCSDDEFRRWLYTAVTRASDRLLLVTP